MPPTTITVPRDRNGPPDSANGGYASGLMAAGVNPMAATVTLRKPPVLEQPLVAQQTNGTVRWYVGDVLVGESEPGTLDIGVPDPPSWQQVLEAKAAYDVDAFHSAHPFPTCYVCGPARSPDEALVLLPAPVGGSGMIAWPWRPTEHLAGDDGRIKPVELWAALDCPSGWAVWDYSSVHLLGRITVRIEHLPEPGQELIVGAWPLGRDGRKGRGASALWTKDGVCLAAAKATWIAVQEAPKPDYV